LLNLLQKGYFIAEGQEAGQKRFVFAGPAEGWTTHHASDSTMSCKDA